MINSIKIYLLLIFTIWKVSGNPIDTQACYNVEPVKMTCCDSIEFMKTEYGNCLKGDTKYLRVIEEQRGNDTCFEYSYYKYIDIELLEDQHGYIQDYVMSCTDVKLKSFVPAGQCKITIDKKRSLLKIESNRKMIAIVKNDMTSDTLIFDESKTIPLTATCSNIEIICAQTHFKTRYCHKKHLECSKLLESYYLPGQLSQSICSNLNWIILLVITLLVFKITSFLINSHFFLIIFPIYYPICLTLYFLYDKLCCKCKICGKSWHPFYTCNTTCKCGAYFNNSQTMKRHLTTQTCKYNTLPIVKNCLHNKVFQFCNNIILIVILLITVIPGTNSLETTHINSDSYKWQHNLKMYLSNLGHGLEKDGFHRVAGALQNYQSDKDIILLEGQDTANFDLSAKTFETMKLNIKYKGQKIAEMGITIEDSWIENKYIPIYRTGATSNFKVTHDELCTGECLERTKKVGWVNFKQEKTSFWGCEEYGCLAVAEGCVWGECDDILDAKTIGTVYEKIQTMDYPKIKVCIYMLSDGFCKSFTTETATHRGVKIQLINNDVNMLPKRLFVDKHLNTYYGEINALGDYDNKCGQLQIVNDTNFGLDRPIFDIICHAVGKKDIKVRQCRYNDFNKCKILQSIVKEGLHTEIRSKEFFIRKSIKDGFLKFAIDMQPYLEIAQNMDNDELKIEVTGKCTGCTGCPIGINCLLMIVSNMNTICNTVSKSMEFSLSTVVLTKGSHSYNMIGYMSEQQYKEYSDLKSGEIDLTICNKNMKLNGEVKLDVNSLEPALDFDKTTLSMGDNKCNVLFCNLLNTPIKWMSGISEMGQIFLYCGIAILILAIVWLFLTFILPVIRDIQHKIKSS